jgi:hypothetical protein
MSVFLSKVLGTHYRHTIRKELYGVEVEVEGPAPFPEMVAGVDPDNAWWNSKPDGSLRGHSMEYVSGVFPDALKAKKEVVRLYDKIGTVNDSMRAGVHIHYNVQSWTVQELFTFLSLYYLFEDTLFVFLGEERKGNLFCLDAKEAGYIPHGLYQCLQSETFEAMLFNNQDMRYSALNLYSVKKFGSIEFRALRTPVTAAPILTWIDIIECLVQGAKRFNNPQEVIDSFSAIGFETVANTVFGAYAPKITKQPNFEDKIRGCIYLHQFWIYLKKWSTK